MNDVENDDGVSRPGRTNQPNDFAGRCKRYGETFLASVQTVPDTWIITTCPLCGEHTCRGISSRGHSVSCGSRSGQKGGSTDGEVRTAASKQVRQSTGLFWVGLNGTWAVWPHLAHGTKACLNTLTLLLPRLIRHREQRFGTLVNCIWLKNRCSSALKTNSAPQRTHVRIWSFNS